MLGIVSAHVPWRVRAAGASGHASAHHLLPPVGVARVFALLRCNRLGIVRAHEIWRVRAASASGHALARIVHRDLGLLHRVVRFRLAHCHHVSAYGGTSVVDGRHSVWMTHVPRAQRRWQAHCRARSRWMCQRRADRRSASGQCLKHHIQLLTCASVCCHVRACARLARRARMARV